MYRKVILADDDVEMLTSMCHMLESVPDEFQILGAVENGQAALSLIERDAPDILVTDITMPEMDGMTLIAKAQAICPGISSVLITCHEDFRYAKEAIGLSVDDYLVKYTVTKKVLLKSLRKISERLGQSQQQKQTEQRMSKEMYRNRENFKSEMMRGIIRGTWLDMDAIRESAALYDVVVPENDFLITGLFIDDFSNTLEKSALATPEELMFALINIFSEVLAYPFVFSYENQIFFIFEKNKGTLPTYGELTPRFQEGIRHTERILRVKPSVIFCGQTYTDLTQCGSAIERLRALRERYFYMGSGLVHGEHCPAPAYLDQPVPTDLLNRLQALGFEPSRLRHCFQDVCSQIAAARYAPAHVRRFFNALAAALSISASYVGKRTEVIFVDDDTFQGCKEQMYAFFRHYAKLIAVQTEKPLSRDIAKLVGYVNENLQKDISLETAAASIYKNSSHVSRQFKKETGLTFSDYLKRQRVQKATYLLQQTDETVEQISSSVGIGNPQYFYSFYKRETGKTPGDVRRRM